MQLTVVNSSNVFERTNKNKSNQSFQLEMIHSFILFDKKQTNNKKNSTLFIIIVYVHASVGL